MRSRYTAYSQHNIEWLFATWHPSRRTPQLYQALTENIADSQWLGLTVIAEEYGSHENEAFVTFFARWLGKSRSGAVYERSRFIREDQRWYYLDGTMLTPGRNDSCPCGSNRKYKKCCGQ